MDDGSVPDVNEHRHEVLRNAVREVDGIISKLKNVNISDGKKEKLIFRLSQICEFYPVVFGNSPAVLLKNKGVMIPVGKVNEKMVAFLGIKNASEVFVFGD